MNKIKFKIWFLIIIVVKSCVFKLEDPDQIQPEEILYLYTKESELISNGIDKTTVIARIPKNAGRLDIKFKTSKGLFIYSGTNEVKEYADSVAGRFRYAQTLIKSDTIPGIAYITADVEKIRRRTSIIIK